MNYYSKLLFVLIFTILFSSCNSNTDTHTDDSITISENTKKDSSYTEEESAYRYKVSDTAKVSQWLRSSILKDDIDFLEARQREYTLDAYDLNNDGKVEYFIGLPNDYFCGSGGCTYYILSNEGDVIALFTVSHAPFQILPSKSQGWNDLVISSTDGQRKLTFDGKSYPGNPSVLPLYKDSIENEKYISVLKEPQKYTF